MLEYNYGAQVRRVIAAMPDFSRLAYGLICCSVWQWDDSLGSLPGTLRLRFTDSAEMALGQAQRQSGDGERGVVGARGREGRSGGDVEVVEIVDLARWVYDRGPRIDDHPSGAAVVRGRLQAELLMQHHGIAGALEHGAREGDQAAMRRVVAEAPVHDDVAGGVEDDAIVGEWQVLRHQPPVDATPGHGPQDAQRELRPHGLEDGAEHLAEGG